jgi:hypothetical protein
LSFSVGVWITESGKRSFSLWNSASGEQLDLGRGDIPRGKGRQEQTKVEARNPKIETNPNDQKA